MNQAVASIIRDHISGLDFVDKIAGLVAPLTFEIKGSDNKLETKTFPIACCVSPEDCQKNGAYNDLMPNSAYKTVIYFEDTGVKFTRGESNWKYYTSSLRLVCWINVAKILGDTCNEGTACTLAAHLIVEIIRALPEFPQHHNPFNFVHSEVVSQDVRDPAIFKAYTYDEKHTQYLMYPYDYFALDIQTTFAICIPGSGVYDADCGHNTDTLDAPVAKDASGVGGTDFDANWNAVTGATGYKIDVATDALFANMVIGDEDAGSGTTVNIDGLTLGITYYYRVRAYNDTTESGNSNVISLTTLNIPTVTTTAIISITSITASSGGNITSDGGASVTARGVCWKTSSNPTVANSKTTDGAGTGAFASAITGLVADTTYYVRAYATNSIGTAYGNEVNFKTTVQDIDGNTYTYVTIGTQQWMVENFRCTKYADGTPIPNLTVAFDWTSEDGTPGHDGAYCWYNNDSANKPDYGALYNWYAENNAHGLAPTGWRVPSKTDLETLVTFLGGSTVAGGKLKEILFTHWTAPNTGATDEVGFTARGSGCRIMGGFGILILNEYGTLWSSTLFNATDSYFIQLAYDSLQSIIGNTSNTEGHVIRCMRDL